MKNEKSHKNKFVPDDSLKPGSGTFSRRDVLKKIVMAPVQLGLFLLAYKAKGIVRAVSEESGISGAGPVRMPSGRAADINKPNDPMGEAQGIFPGRVSWVWNPSATNPGYTDTLARPDAPEVQFDGWFMDKNTNQEIVDHMLASGLRSISGKEEMHEVWDALFRYHNRKRGKGNVPYRRGEKIFLKLNRTSVFQAFLPGYRRDKQHPVSLLCETSPHLVLSMLRQLVNVAGVPQESIYLGDGQREVYQDEYLKYTAEFPRVHIISRTGDTHGRTLCGESSRELIFYSDNKKVMDRAGSDKIYDVLEDAEYLVNLPAMKGHAIAGITLCAKNHFGTQARPTASHLHSGLNGRNRRRYGQYRVLVDIMGNEQTGGKNLFYMLDALWTGTSWSGHPVKFLMSPFDNHFCSSFLFSHDPVAIESVAYDFLEAEFSRPEHTVDHIIAPGVDDHLHQAADKRNWPEGIVYAPDGGLPMPGSLGTHEHWNNPEDKMYSRNLGTGEGIELVKIFQNGIS